MQRDGVWQEIDSNDYRTQNGYGSLEETLA